LRRSGHFDLGGRNRFQSGVEEKFPSAPFFICLDLRPGKPLWRFSATSFRGSVDLVQQKAFESTAPLPALLKTPDHAHAGSRQAKLGADVQGRIALKAQLA